MTPNQQTAEVIHVAKMLDVSDWEDYLFDELLKMGIPITEELIMLITEISLNHFEDIGLIDYNIRFEP